MTSNKEDLSEFRVKIDKIDDQIINLLIERTEIVKQVGQHKAKTSASRSFIRAGREATMLRNLTKKAGDKFPPAAIATIWRIIISMSLCTEQKMSIAAYVSGSDKSCIWRAREYYGSFINITPFSSTDEVIANVANGDISIGILPLIDDSKNPWWVRPQEEKNDVYVFARIPFVESRELLSPPVLAIANVTPESTGDDVSVIALCNAGNKNSVETAFADAGLKARIIAENNEKNYLVETEGFLSAGDSILDKIKNSLDGITPRLLGAYAAPIRSS